MKKDVTSAQKRPVKSGRFAGESSALSQRVFSTLDMVMCMVVIAGCISLHFAALFHQLVLPIEVGLSLFSFATPISGLLYLSAAQVIPDPPEFPLSCAQMAVAGFFVWQLMTGKAMDLFRWGRPLWMTVAPFFVWGAGMSLMHGDYQFGLLLVFSILTGCAVAALVAQSGNRLVTCVAAFLVGQALAMCLFWILKLHLGEPTQSFDIELYGDSTMAGARIGTARGNANMLGPPMALVCMAAIGWFFSRPKQSWLAGLISLACLAAALPPLLGSGCRGGIISLAWGVIFLLVISVLAGRFSVGLPLAMAAVAAVLLFGWHRFGLDEHWQEMLERQEQEQAAEGTIVAGRTLEWTAAWKGILDSPLVGGGTVQKTSFFGMEEMWMSHSTYLDAGLVGGFPGMALFCWFVLKPILELWRRKREPVVAWLLAIYLVSIVSIGTTSSMQSKHFWILWGLASIAFLPAVARFKNRRKRRKTEIGAASAGGRKPAVQ